MFWWLLIPGVSAGLMGVVSGFIEGREGRPLFYTGGRNRRRSYDYDSFDDPCDYVSTSRIASHNGRTYDDVDDYPRCNDGSPDMRYAENYRHADDD